MTAAWWRRRPPEGPGEVLAKNAELLGHAIASIVHVHRLVGREAEQLDSYLRRRLAENDYEALRNRGEATFVTFLVVVAERLAGELRDELWARWRQEAADTGNAEVVAALERLVYDEAMPLDDALHAAGVVADPERAEVEALWARRPWGGERSPRGGVRS